ncbi:MAG: ABC transporter permease [Clostridiales bacterium]|nr:ABC transporter permease [Clostridiales bacterium]
MSKTSLSSWSESKPLRILRSARAFLERYRKQSFAFPYILWMALFVVIPIILIVVYAFTSAGNGFTLKNFSGIISYAPVFGRSLWLALVATAVCLLIGYPVALAISRMNIKTQRIVLMLVMLPMWINFLLRTYAWMSLLENTGLINRALAALGVFDLINSLHANDLNYTPITHFQLINTNGAVVLGMVYNYLPFMILPIQSVIVKIDPFVIEAAEDLGADRGTVFRKVIFPLSLSGVISGITMVFVPAVSTFVISKLLSNGTVMLLGDLIEMQFTGSAYNPHLGSAISLIMMAIVVICMSIMNKFGEGEEQAVMM